MVSFFGLKFGGDRKKKHDKTADVTQWKHMDGEALRERRYLDTALNRQDLAFLEGSESIPRPGTSSSSRSFGGLRRPNAPHARGVVASSSMVDLSATHLPATPQPSTSSSNDGAQRNVLKKPVSEANLRNRSKTSGSMSLWPPTPAMTGTASTQSNDRRPGTSGSGSTSASKKTTVNLMEPRHGRDSKPTGLRRPTLSSTTSVAAATAARPSTSAGTSLSPTTPISATAPQLPKSPLGQFEFNLQPLNVKKPEPNRPEADDVLKQREPLPRNNMEEADDEVSEIEKDLATSSPCKTMYYSPSKAYPSPPPSVKDLERPKMSLDTDYRPPSRQRDGSGTGASLHVKTNALPSGPTSLPSPAASLPRSSEDKVWTGPLIQNVRAKRDTLTVKAARLQSALIDVPVPSKAEVSMVTPDESAESDLGFIFDLDSRSGTPRGCSPPPPPGPPSNTTMKPPPPISQREFIPYRPPGCKPPPSPSASPLPASPAPAEATPAVERGFNTTMTHDAVTSGPSPQTRHQLPALSVEIPFDQTRGVPTSAAALSCSESHYGLSPSRPSEVPTAKSSSTRLQTDPTSDVPHTPLASPPPSSSPAAKDVGIPRQENQCSRWAPENDSSPPTIIDHPSKGPQDFNRRPPPAEGQVSNRRSLGLSSTNRRPPPPRLSPAPPPPRAQRDVDSPTSGSLLVKLPSREYVAAPFCAPRQAPSPRGGPPSSLDSPQFSSHLEPPLSSPLENPRKPPSPTKSFQSITTPTRDCNPNWPLIDSGPPSGASFGDGGGGSSYGSNPGSPSPGPIPAPGDPLESPAFGTFAIGNGTASPGPSHWAQPSDGHLQDSGQTQPPWAEGSLSSTPAQEEKLDGAGSRPDFGLRAPTGIADDFRVGFI